MQSLRVLIADDHSVVRAGVKLILTEAGMTIAGEVASGDELLKVLPQLNPDVILLDISMPGRNGLEILKDIRAYNKRIPILILSMYPEDRYALRLIKAGAAGYLNKSSADELLVRAVQKVASGEKYISQELASTMALHLDEPIDQLPHEALSHREFQILSLLGSGLAVSEIAKRLNISVPTVSTHRSKILQKMRMKNNAQLISYVVKHGLSEETR